MWANKDVLFPTGQLSTAAKSLIRDTSIRSPGEAASVLTEKEGEAEQKQTPRVTLGHSQDWDSMFPLPPTGQF